MSPPDRASSLEGPEAVDEGAHQVAGLFALRRYDDIEAMVVRYSTLQDKFQDGKFKLTGFEEFFYDPPADRDFEKRHAEIDRWRAARPSSVAAARAEAIFWRSYAWDARGEGYAQDVPPDRWRVFQERLSKAQALLQETKAYAKRDPFWYENSIDVSLELNQPLQIRLAHYEEGWREFPDFFNLAFAMIRSLEPRWGGSVPAQSAFINAAVARAPAQSREILYTRLWWYADEDSQQGVDVVREGLSWPRMNAGFRALVASTPDSVWNASNYAYYACRVGDRATYKSVRQGRGSRIRSDAFKLPYSLLLCDQSAAVAAK